MFHLVASADRQRRTVVEATAAYTLTVGYDGSEAARQAVRWATREAHLRKATLRLLHARTTPPGEGNRPDVTDDNDRSDGQRLLTEAEHIVTAESQRVLTERVFPATPPTRALVHESHHTQMLIAGAHGLEALSPAAVGSTAEIVTLHAHCPVAVIHRLPEKQAVPDKGAVLVGVDGSPVGEQAIALAFEEASLRQAPLLALHAWSDVPTDPWLHSTNQGWSWDHVEDRESAMLAERLAGWQEQYPQVQVERIVVRDRPVRSLIERANQAQLIVVGSRGRGGFTGMLLGSTSQALLHAAPIPLIISRYETSNSRYRYD